MKFLYSKGEKVSCGNCGGFFVHCDSCDKYKCACGAHRCTGKGAL